MPSTEALTSDGYFRLRRAMLGGAPPLTSSFQDELVGIRGWHRPRSRAFHLVLPALLSAVLASVSVAAPAQAQTTWIGGVGQNQWSNNNNWSNGAPQTGTTTATFPASAHSLTVDVNIPHAVAGTLQFNVPSYTLNLSTGNSALMIFGAGIVGTSPTCKLLLGTAWTA